MDTLFDLHKYLCFSIKGRFTDTVIKSKSKCFYAHRAVMVTASDYFRGCISYNSRSNRNNVIDLTQFTDEVVTLLIGYAYTRKNKYRDLNATNVRQVIIAADFVGMSTFVNICLIKMASLLTTQNAIEVFQFATIYSFK